MKIPDDIDLGRWWPYSTDGYAPEEMVRALASLAAGAPTTAFCLSGPTSSEGLLNWRLLAVAGEALIEVQGVGPERRSGDYTFGELPSSVSLKLARCTRLADAVVAVRVLATESTGFPDQDRIDPWAVTWALDLASGEQLVLPGEDRAQRSRSRVAAAEAFAVTVLRHLQNR